MITFGIIGTGAIAGHHARSIAELEGCKLAGVCSSTAERAVIAGRKFGVPGFSELHRMLDEVQPDVLCICTASGNHLEPTLAAAARGIHVLTEKPLEVSLERADKMITACRDAGVKLGCIFQNRFKPGFLRLKEAVEQGKLGRLLTGNAYIKWYRNPEYYSSSSWKGTMTGDGGAALINQGIHTIDLLLDIMGEVSSVFGKVRTMVHNIEGEDLGIGLITFTSGALGTVEGSTAMIPGYPERLEVFGEKGSVMLENGKVVAWQVPGEEQALLPADSQNDSSSSDPMALGHLYHRLQIADMIEAIRHDREPLVNGESARKALALIKGIYVSSADNREISFDQ